MQMPKKSIILKMRSIFQVVVCISTSERRYVSRGGYLNFKVNNILTGPSREWRSSKCWANTSELRQVVYLTLGNSNRYAYFYSDFPCHRINGTFVRDDFRCLNGK